MLLGAVPPRGGARDPTTRATSSTASSRCCARTHWRCADAAARRLSSILVIGSGPIVIGQACEFDYSGTQACQVLRAEGYRVVLVNSNPATIMTDPATADVTYVEPLDADVLIDIIERERPDALLPTLGGQTALNLTMELVRRGVLERLGVEVIGARPEAIATAEDRERFKEAMADIGLAVPESGFAHDVDEALVIAHAHRLADHHPTELHPRAARAPASPTTTTSFCAWPARASPRRRSARSSSRSRSRAGRSSSSRSCATSPTTASSSAASRTSIRWACTPVTRSPWRPSQTLSDVEYQAMRDDAFAVLRRVGVETGGSNVQFAVDPDTGERLVIEMNPRVSRSSALASKATGFPDRQDRGAPRRRLHARRDQNDITRVTPASFEPVIDYVVTKIPRWAFEKLPGSTPQLGTRMQSVGEVMAIGRNFAESLQKAVRSLEQGRDGFRAGGDSEFADVRPRGVWERCEVPTPERLFALHEVLWRGATRRRGRRAYADRPVVHPPARRDRRT